MIRFDQRNFDVQETERLFKKVIHPTHRHNSIRLVDKDGIPMRSPNSAALSRLHSSYVLTPRGVPARKSSHSYSGQTTKDKMHNLVNSMDVNSHEMASFGSIQNYGLSSAGSSRHYIPANLTPKKRTFGSGPPRAVTAMAKSASSGRSRFLTMTPDENMLLDPENEKWNGSQQGKRLEKEWSALSQCRALKRSSEIVSHRVDRMYFMTGNKLKLQQKYHVEDDELEHLKELSQARASARSARWSSRTKKGDVYRPDRSAASSKGVIQGVISESNGQSEQVNGDVHGGSRKSSRASKEERVKENTDPASNIIVTQKPLTPKPSSCKSPLQGWAEGGKGDREPTETELISNLKETTLHEDQVDGLEVPSANEKTARDNAEASKENVSAFQNDNNVENNAIEKKEVVENGEVFENGETEQSDNGEERTEASVFVTEGAELGDHSVQENGNSGNIESDKSVENGKRNGAV